MLKAITAFGICIAAANITPAFASENIATTSNTTAHRVAVDPANKPWSPETPSGFQRNNAGWIYARLSKTASDQCEAREGYECSKELPCCAPMVCAPVGSYGGQCEKKKD